MAELLRLRVEKPDPRTVVVHAEGEFAGMEVLGEEARLLDAAGELESGTLLLDFALLEYIDSAGVGILYKLVKTLNEKGAKLCISGASKDIKKILHAAALHKIVQVL